jgi:CTP:molybdopterin cytidylyltransferase MocA
MSTGAVILAAGASTRLGRPKQLVTVNGETLVHRATRLALDAGCNPVVVVEGAVPLAPGLADLSIDVVRCAEWKRGPGATLKRGVAHVQTIVDGVLLLLVDQPAIEVDDLRRLLSAPGGIAAAQYDGVLGVPARFSKARFSVLATLPDERGAGPWLQAHAAEVTAVPMPGASRDVDTPEDVAALKP